MNPVTTLRAVTSPVPGPYATDPRLEASIVGFAMTFPELVRPMLGSIDPSYFSVNLCEWAWRGLQAILTAGMVPDVSSIGSWLKARQRLGPDGLNDLEMMVQEAQVISALDPRAIETAARQLVDLWRGRRVGEIGARLADDAQRDFGDADAFCESAVAQLQVIARSGFGAAPESRRELIARIINPARPSELGVSSEEFTEDSMLRTGLRDLDAILEMLIPCHKTVIAARPGVGKTILALQILIAAAKRKIGALFVSAEMPVEELWQRLIASVSGVDIRSVINPSRRTYEEQSRMNGSADFINSFPLDVIDATSLTAEDIATRIHIHAAKAQPSIGVVALDYVQNVKPSRGRERDDERHRIGHTARTFSDACRRIKAHGIECAQFNRAIDERHGRDAKPRLRDLDGSSVIEKLAQNVIGLWRPLPEDESRVMATVMKQRAGRRGQSLLRLNGEMVRFEDWVDEPPLLARAPE